MLVAADPSGYDNIFKLMKSAKKGARLSHVESAASSAVKIACDINARAIIVLSETGETARYVSKFHPEQPIMCVMVDPRIGRQIEGYMCNAFAVTTDAKRGDGAHVKIAFEKGKQAGLFKDGDAVVCVNTQRNDQGIKQFMVRIIFVTSGEPGLQTNRAQWSAQGQGAPTADAPEPAAKRTRR